MHFVMIEKGGVKKYLEKAHMDYYAHVLSSIEHALKYAVKIEKNGDEDYKNYQKLDMFKKSIVLYSAMSLEAFINYYATRYEIGYGDKLRNVKPALKLELFIELKTSKKISNATLGTVGEIFQLRNSIAHTKARTVTKKGKEYDKSIHAILERYDFVNLIKRFNAVFTEISEIDDDEHDLKDMLVPIEKLKRK